MNMCERRGFLAKGLLAGEQLLHRQNLNRSQANTLTHISQWLCASRSGKTTPPASFFPLQKVSKLAQRNLKTTGSQL